MSRRPKPQRGVILLIVLGILALFALVGVMYVITAGQHNTAVRNEVKGEQVGDPPDALLNNALLQVLRGTVNQTSALQANSLLEDMYGNDLIYDGKPLRPAGTLSTKTPQFVAGPGGSWETEFRGGVDGIPSPDDFSDYYTGCLFTMVSGAQRGRSGLIVGYDYVGGNNNPQMRMRIMPFPGLAAHQTIDFSQVRAGVDTFMINGRPFNGTGFGLSSVSVASLNPTDPNSLMLNAYDPWSQAEFANGSLPRPWELALLPNTAFFRPARVNQPLNATYPLDYADPAGPGGADEDYDAVDFQNWILAARMSAIVGNAPRVVTPIPSLHRPEVVRYWMQRAIDDFGISLPNGSPLSWEAILAAAPSNQAQLAVAELARRSSLRPSTLHHFVTLNSDDVHDPNEPDFAGRFPPSANPPGPVYDPLNGPWDVDTDGDGELDSVWVDLGFPVQRRPDGTLYKPLFAIQVIDLDGKLNLDAHGNVSHLAQSAAQAQNAAAPRSGSVRIFDPASTTPLDPAYAAPGPHATWFPPDNPNPNLTTPLVLPTGEGYGVAEINLNVLVDDAITGSQSGSPRTTGSPTWTPMGDVARLMLGAWDSASGKLVPGRYGDESSIANLSGAFSIDIAGPRPNMWASQSPRDIISRQNLALDYFGVPLLDRGQWGSFALPADLDGDGTLCLDLRGQPYFAEYNQRFGFGEPGEKINNPYDFDLSRMTPPSEKALGTIVEHSDAPFSPADFERLLRFSDIDAQGLPDRLLALAPNLFEYDPLDANSALAAYRRNLVTVASFDLPTPSVLPPIETVWDDPGTSDDRSAFDPKINEPGATRLTDLVRARIFENNGGTASTDLINNSLRVLLSYESRANLKFDLNGPFGDGRDNDASQLGGWDANGVVDEAEEGFAGNSQPAWTPTATVPTATAADANRDGAINNLDREPGARGAYARHLYVLALLAADKRFQAPNGAGGSPLETARRAAQWAVNAADYRDRDVIMTGFEYDREPFTDNDSNSANGTWDVDGRLDTNEGGPWREVVWGCERPELLITETLATHDRRLEDTDQELDGHFTGDPAPDNDLDFDQARPPEGSLWVELYNPWRTQTGRISTAGGVTAAANQDLPAELYTRLPNGDVVLDLAQVSQERVSSGLGPGSASPVWRLVVQELATGAQPGDFPDPDDGPDPVPTNNAQIARVAYFLNSANTPPTHREPLNAHHYYAQWQVAVAPGKGVYVPPGRYLVVGPEGTPGTPTRRAQFQPADPPLMTIIGKRKDYVNSAGLTQNKDSLFKTRRIELLPNKDNYNAPFQVLSYGGDSDPDGNPATPPVPAYPKPWLTDAQREIEAPVAVWMGTNGSRFSVTEPKEGYPAKFGMTIDAQTKAFTTVRDEPMDTGSFFSLPNGVHEGYFMVHLQRLANPLRAWNADTNPYRTIDSAPIDVNIFNGEQMPATPPPNPALLTQVENTYQILSRQRGDSVHQATGNSLAYSKALTFWLQEPPMRLGNSPLRDNPLQHDDPNNMHVYPYPVGHSLGYVNFDFEANLTDGPDNWIRPTVDPSGTGPWGVLASLYSAAPGAWLASVDFTGVRKYTTPWLAWPNRPFVSSHELLNVVGTRSSRLLNPGTFKRTPQSPAATAPYANRVAATTKPNDYAADPWEHLNFLESNAATRFALDQWFRGPSFPHLLNFFQTKAGNGGVFDNTVGKAPHWYRMLDYVHVPSRFVGTETYLSPLPTPVAFGVNPGNPASQGYHEFFPPYNRLSHYREPGRVNLNTIFDEGETWRAMTGYVNQASPPGVPNWEVIRQSRSGNPAYNPAVKDLALPMNPLVPTRFANPFRSAAGHPYVPIPELLVDASGSPRDPIDTTLLRTGIAAGPQESPLLGYDRNGPLNASAPINTDANPNFRHYLLQKLGNLATTRSNVYAVWITVGYFEVKQVGDTSLFDGNGHVVYPDGYRLVREVGVDSGQIERHRGFYLIDRTIPVAFQRGFTHNVENCILLRRIIE